MTTGYNNCQETYTNNRVQTANRVELVIMLYEGAIAFINKAIESMHYSSYDKVNSNIHRALDIIVELRMTLNMEAGEVSNKLETIYEFIEEQLRSANLKKEKTGLNEAKAVIENLLTAWKQVLLSDTDNPPNESSFSNLLNGFSMKA